MKAAIDSCLFSIATDNPAMFDDGSIKLLYHYAMDMGGKLLDHIMPGLDDDEKHKLTVAFTTAFHEGVRLGCEYTRLGGDPPEWMQ